MTDLPSSFVQALRFWSRLPVPVLDFEVEPHGRPDMEQLAPVTPLAGALLGCIAAAVLLLAHVIGLPATPTALFAVAALVVMTGALHEDGLADLADGFGGGRTLERKLEIMRDSRIGSYGATALVLGLGAKVSLLGALIASAGPVAAAIVLIASIALSRIAGLMPLMLLAPARSDGAGAAAGRLSADAWRLGAIPACLVGLLLLWFACGLASALFAPLLAILAAYGVTRLAERQIGGQTGDVCGAAVLLAEVAFLVGALAPLGWRS